MEGKNGLKIKGRIVARDRSESCESIEDMLKWKRDESEAREEGKVFRTSKKTVKSPDIERVREEGIKETLRRLMREKLREVMNEIRKVKGWKEELKEWRKKIREKVKGRVKEQGERFREELG